MGKETVETRGRNTGDRIHEPIPPGNSPVEPRGMMGRLEIGRMERRA